MNHYNVHIYREMRLTYEDIEAESPQHAAALAHDLPTGDAADISDCGGETLAALVDSVGDSEYTHSQLIDFAAERLNRATPDLLAFSHQVVSAKQAGESVADDLYLAAVLMSALLDAGSPKPPTPNVHTLLAEQRQIAAIWGVEDVQAVRPDLDADRAWEVLQMVDRQHDASEGIHWETFKYAAEDLFGEASEAGEGEV